MTWLPPVRVARLSSAWPEALSATVPSSVVPSKKETLPVGIAPGPVTVAVKVTFWRNGEGLSDEASVIVVAAWATLTTTAVERLGSKKLNVSAKRC